MWRHIAGFCPGYYLTRNIEHYVEVDEVTLAEDMNESIADIAGLLSVQPETPLTKDQETELFLYYVACTRPRKALHNARYM